MPRVLLPTKKKLGVAGRALGDVSEAEKELVRQRAEAPFHPFGRPDIEEIQYTHKSSNTTAIAPSLLNSNNDNKSPLPLLLRGKRKTCLGGGVRKLPSQVKNDDHDWTLVNNNNKSRVFAGIYAVAENNDSLTANEREQNPTSAEMPQSVSTDAVDVDGQKQLIFPGTYAVAGNKDSTTVNEREQKPTSADILQSVSTDAVDADTQKQQQQDINHATGEKLDPTKTMPLCSTGAVNEITPVAPCQDCKLLRVQMKELKTKHTAQVETERENQQRWRKELRVELTTKFEQEAVEKEAQSKELRDKLAGEVEALRADQNQFRSRLVSLLERNPETETIGEDDQAILQLIQTGLTTKSERISELEKNFQQTKLELERAQEQLEQQHILVAKLRRQLLEQSWAGYGRSSGTCSQDSFVDEVEEVTDPSELMHTTGLNPYSERPPTLAPCAGNRNFKIDDPLQDHSGAHRMTTLPESTYTQSTDMVPVAASAAPADPASPGLTIDQQPSPGELQPNKRKASNESSSVDCEEIHSSSRDNCDEKTSKPEQEPASKKRRQEIHAMSEDEQPAETKLTSPGVVRRSTRNSPAREQREPIENLRVVTSRRYATAVTAALRSQGQAQPLRDPPESAQNNLTRGRMLGRATTQPLARSSGRATASALGPASGDTLHTIKNHTTIRLSGERATAIWLAQPPKASEDNKSATPSPPRTRLTRARSKERPGAASWEQTTQADENKKSPVPSPPRPRPARGRSKERPGAAPLASEPGGDNHTMASGSVLTRSRSRSKDRPNAGSLAPEPGNDNHTIASNSARSRSRSKDKCGAGEDITSASLSQARRNLTRGRSKEKATSLAQSSETTSSLQNGLARSRSLGRAIATSSVQSSDITSSSVRNYPTRSRSHSPGQSSGSNHRKRGQSIANIALTKVNSIPHTYYTSTRATRAHLKYDIPAPRTSRRITQSSSEEKQKREKRIKYFAGSSTTESSMCTI